MKVVRADADPGLRGRALLHDRARLESVLSAGVESIEVVAHRPGRRAVAKLALGGGRTAFLKLLASKRFQRAERSLARLAGFDAGHQVAFALPFAWLKEECAFITLEAGGTALHELWRARRPVDVDLVVRAIGELTARVAPEGLPSRSVEDERRSTLLQLERGRDALPALAEVAKLVERTTLPAAEGTAFVHADMHDKQIFVRAESIELIDLEGAARGDPRIDRINLIEHARLRAEQWGGSPGARALRDALVTSDPAELRLRGLVRARLAGVYAQRPRWTRLALELATSACPLLV